MSIHCSIAVPLAWSIWALCSCGAALQHMHCCTSVECWFLKGHQEAGGSRRSKRQKTPTGKPNVASQRKAPATGTRCHAAGAAQPIAEGRNSVAEQAAHTRGAAGESAVLVTGKTQLLLPAARWHLPCCSDCQQPSGSSAAGASVVGYVDQLVQGNVGPCSLVHCLQ